MNTPTVVVVSGAGTAPLTAVGDTPLQALFGEVLGAEPTVILVSALPRDTTDEQLVVQLRAAPVNRVLGVLGVTALSHRLSRFPLGRLLNSLGPGDAGRVLWRSVRRDRAVMALLGRADILVAADAAAVTTVWHAARRYPAARALTDVDAALRVLRSMP